MDMPRRAFLVCGYEGTSGRRIAGGGTESGNSRVEQGGFRTVPDEISGLEGC